MYFCNNNSFYSIPLKYKNEVFAIFQFAMLRDEKIENQQKRLSTHQIEILDYFRESCIEIITNCLIKTVERIDKDFLMK